MTIQSYGSLRKSPRIDLTRAFPLPIPLTLYLEPTNVCNFRCVLCPESFPDYQEQAGYYQRMPLPLFEKIIADIRAMGRIRSLKLYFEGEPLLHPELHNMVAIARAAEIADRIEITSNGSLLTEKRARQLIEAGLDYLQVSIYSVDEATHREITGIKNTPAQILQNVRRLIEMRHAAGLTKPFVYAKLMHDSPQGEMAFRSIYEGVADEIGVQYRHNWGGFVGVEMLKRAYSPNQEQLDRDFQYKKKACPFPFYLMAIKANGEVSACCVDWNGGVNIGDLRKQSLLEVWNGEKLRGLQRLHVAGKRGSIPACANCDALFTAPDMIDSLTLEEFDQKTTSSIAD